MKKIVVILVVLVSTGAILSAASRGRNNDSKGRDDDGR